MSEAVQRYQSKIALIRRIPRPMPVAQRVRHNVETLKLGGSLQIGKEIYLVERRHRYEEGKSWKWYELELTRVSDGETIFLEYEHDDRLEMSLWDRTGLPLHTIGLREKDLERFDDDEDGTFFWDGTSFRYDESDKARFYPDDVSDVHPFYYWDFSGSSGRRLIGVEDWSESLGDREYEVCIGRELSGSEVTILAMGGESHA